MDDAEIEKLKERIERLEEGQKELEIEIRKLADRLDFLVALEESRADYLETFGDACGHRDC